MDKTIKIALAGNPNSGKTTLFNALTGSNQFVGNWPGVTVEKKEGKLKGRDNVIITDLPGIYSLSPYSLEEVVARNYLINECPDAILNIIDGTSLERSLYLTTQLVELGIPVVIAINMMDVIRKNGYEIDTAGLEKELGVKIVEISALKEAGTGEAAEAAIDAALSNKSFFPKHRFAGSVEHALAHIEEAVLHDMPSAGQRWYAIKIFERDKKISELLDISPETLSHIDGDIRECEREMDDDAESIIISQRYGYIESIIGKYYIKAKHGFSASEKIDSIVTNRYLALPIFAVIIFIVYFISVSSLGSYLSGFVNDTLFGEWINPALSKGLESAGTAGWLNGLITDGIVGGVGAVLGFVPQMMLLFIFLAFLEACGYMSRIAFIMDKIFRRFGLSGKSFIPVLVGTGCSVPGIMASRTIESIRDRRMTVMTTSFMPCSAKLPVIALISGAMFGGEWWVAPSAYFAGIASIALSGIILKKTKPFAGEPAAFVLELPAYHMPTVSNILRSMWERVRSFIKKAGTIILLASVAVWLLSNLGFKEGSFGLVSMENSFLAKIGGIIAFIFKPLGWGDWRASAATLNGLIAKENVVSTFGVLYGENTRTILKEIYSPLAGYSFLMFNLLCAPCIAAVGAIRREMNNGKWTIFAIAYQCAFAYIVSLCIYQFGMLINGKPDITGTIAAFTVLFVFLFMLFRPYKRKGAV